MIYNDNSNEKETFNGNEKFSAEYVNKFKRKGKWNIVNALDCILQLSKDSELCDEFWKATRAPLRFLRKELDMTNIQLVTLAFLIETGKPECWRTLGNFVGLSRLSIMTYSEEIEELISKGWLYRCVSRENGMASQGFRLERGVITALRKNKVFVPECLEGLSLQKFMDRMEHYYSTNIDSFDMDINDLMEWIDHLIQKNMHLEICKIIENIQDFYERLFLISVLVDYSQFADSEGEGLYIKSFTEHIEETMAAKSFIKTLSNGGLSIFDMQLVEFECIDGIVNNERILVTERMKDKILEGYIPSRSQCKPNKTMIEKALTRHQSLKGKELFYNSSEADQIGRLTQLLQEDKFKGVQERLKEEGMRTGFSCIFYGEPGTGKTETVYQIAKKTGRDIMHIDIAGMRDKWVGETEKNIKKVFEKYRSICHNESVKPILLFNEADALFGKRKDNAESSVDKMNNSMQNIILQEMENLEGILIATTNLATSLDSAFERRFLFKIEFKKPEKEVRALIWKSMLGDNITMLEATNLANAFNFSGGQIENIARKRAIDYILEGSNPSIEKIKDYCNCELLNNRKVSRVGF